MLPDINTLPNNLIKENKKALFEASIKPLVGGYNIGTKIATLTSPNSSPVYSSNNTLVYYPSKIYLETEKDYSWSITYQANHRLQVRWNNKKGTLEMRTTEGWWAVIINEKQLREQLSQAYLERYTIQQKPSTTKPNRFDLIKLGNKPVKNTPLPENLGYVVEDFIERQTECIKCINII